MKQQTVKRLVAVAVTIAGIGTATLAHSQTCKNSCVTMAIPKTDDGVYTKLDGSADAVMWPPTQELRTIRISALNERSEPCDPDRWPCSLEGSCLSFFFSMFPSTWCVNPLLSRSASWDGS